MTQVPTSRALTIKLADAELEGDLTVPPGATGLVVFAHGSGSSRLSPRNQQVARSLADGGLATLLFDLLTAEEEHVDLRTREYRFDIALLGRRLIGVTEWLASDVLTRALRIGYFGASTGAAAALIAAAARPEQVHAVVSRGGRPDLAQDVLADVRSPTLLIVGGLDHPVIRMNESALEQLGGPKQLVIVPGATHLFEERGTLERVAELALAWFRRHLGPSAT
jgi:putative phosphoribosyl transferase